MVMPSINWILGNMRGPCGRRGAIFPTTGLFRQLIKEDSPRFPLLSNVYFGVSNESLFGNRQSEQLENSRVEAV